MNLEKLTYKSTGESILLVKLFCFYHNLFQISYIILIIIKMPKEKTKFQDCWLSEINANGETLKSWCSKSCNYSARCNICKVEIKCDKSGIQQIHQHAKTSQHRKYSSSVLSPKQTKLIFSTQASSSTL